MDEYLRQHHTYTNIKAVHVHLQVNLQACSHTHCLNIRLRPLSSSIDHVLNFGIINQRTPRHQRLTARNMHVPHSLNDAYNREDLNVMVE